MMVIQELRHEYRLDLLLEIAQLPKATFYYHCKNQEKVDKYALAKAEITEIFHENKGRYGYIPPRSEAAKRMLLCVDLI